MKGDVIVARRAPRFLSWHRNFEMLENGSRAQGTARTGKHCHAAERSEWTKRRAFLISRTLMDETDLFSVLSQRKLLKRRQSGRK